MPLTFGGKPAATVALRSPLLPPPDLAAEQRREVRRAQDDDRLARVIEAARHRGRQRAYCIERERRLLEVRGRLDRWLDRTEAEHPSNWWNRNARAVMVLRMARRYHELADGFADKADALIKSKPPKQQELLSAAYFAGLAELPTRRPDGVPGMGRGRG